MGLALGLILPLIFAAVTLTSSVSSIKNNGGIEGASNHGFLDSLKDTFGDIKNSIVQGPLLLFGKIASLFGAGKTSATSGNDLIFDESADHNEIDDYAEAYQKPHSPADLINTGMLHQSSPLVGQTLANHQSGVASHVGSGTSSAQQVQSIAENPTTSSVTDAVASDTATSQGSGGQGAQDAGLSFNNMLSLLGLGGVPNYPYFDFSADIADQRQYGEQMIADARQWEQQMADTRYQRAVKDIEAAGLNPWLALQQGSSISPATVGSVDTGSALGAMNMSSGNGVNNSSSAVMVALISALTNSLSKTISGLISKL